MILAGSAYWQSASGYKISSILWGCLFLNVPQAQVLDLHIVVHAVVRALAAQARLLDAAKGHVLGGQNTHVGADHAVFQGLGHAEDSAHVAAVEVAGQAKLGVVGRVDGFLLGLELEDRGQGFPRARRACRPWRWRPPWARRTGRSQGW